MVTAGLIVSKTQPSSDALRQAKPDAHGAQIRFYEALNLAQISQVTLLAARYVRDMAVPFRVVIPVRFFFDPNLDDKRVRIKFGRVISTFLRPLRYQTTRF